MAKTLKDYVQVFNVVSADVCRSVIDMYESDPQWVQHTWYNNVEDDKRSHHQKELDVLYHKNLSVLAPSIEKALNSYYETTGLTNLVSNYSNIRLNKYKTGTIMSEHFDLIRRNKTDGIPVLTFLGMLNDDYTGGDFIMNGEVVEMKQGDVIVFPSTFLYPHSVREVTSGTRYSFVTWSY
jgi:predicted 2-oxoglutarate/Fe(II)-dependent dioxygenase YbiX